MLENPPLSAQDPSSNVIKRYAPPNQRNRSLGRRKSGERFDRSINPYVTDGEKSQAAASRIAPINDHRDSGNFTNDNPHTGLIALEGCGSSEASQLLNDRWAAAIHCCNDPSIDSSERPVMYSGSSASVWGHVKLPHQLMSPGGIGSPGSQTDFMGELRRAMQSANASF